MAVLLSGFTQDFTSVPNIIAENLPKTGNYFFSYIILQAFSVSAATLLQLGRLFALFVGFLRDRTARQKWQTRRVPEIRWGTFFPVYTSLAVIGKRSFRSYGYWLTWDRSYILCCLPLDLGFQYYHLQHVSRSTALQHFEARKILYGYWRPGIPQGNQPAVRGPVHYEVLSDRPVLPRPK